MLKISTKCLNRLVRGAPPAAIKEVLMHFPGAVARTNRRLNFNLSPYPSRGNIALHALANGNELSLLEDLTSRLLPPDGDQRTVYYRTVTRVNHIHGTTSTIKFATQQPQPSAFKLISRSTNGSCDFCRQPLHVLHQLDDVDPKIPRCTRCKSLNLIEDTNGKYFGCGGGCAHCICAAI